jgi:WD40 repeat protein
MSIAESTNNPIGSYRFPMWENVPEDLTISVISSFDPESLNVCGKQVCKQWRRFFESEKVLPQLCHLHFPTVLPRKINNFPKFLSLLSNLPYALCSVTTLPGDTAEITALVLAETKYTDILFSSQGKTVKFWNLGTNTRLGTLQYPSKVLSLARAEDKTLFAGCEDGTIWAWKNATLSRFAEGHTGRVKTLLINGRLIFSGSSDGTIRIWDMTTGRCKGVLDVKGHKGPIHLLAISEDGKTLFSGSHDKTVKAWDLSDNTCIDTLEGRGVPRSFALEPSGTLLVSTKEGVLRWPLTKANSQESNFYLDTDLFRSHTMAIAKTGMVFVGISTNLGNNMPGNQSIYAWDRKTDSSRILVFGDIAPSGPLVSGGGTEVIGCSRDKRKIQVISYVATPLDILVGIADELEAFSSPNDWFGSFAEAQFDNLNEETKCAIYVELYHCIGKPGRIPLKEGRQLFHSIEGTPKVIAEAIRNYVRKAIAAEK